MNRFTSTSVGATNKKQSTVSGLLRTDIFLDNHKSDYRITGMGTDNNGSEIELLCCNNENDFVNTNALSRYHQQRLQKVKY